MHDLFFAQGFVHAQDRLWQMELHRRIATGRLSELFGAQTLAVDRTLRTFGFHRIAQSDWARANDEARQVLLAYCEGVNACLQHPSTRLPLECLLLRHCPEPWTPEDSLAFSRLMIWQLSPGWYGQLVSAALLATVGEERLAELTVRYPEHNPLTLPASIDVNRLAATHTLCSPHGPFLNRGQGSNAWVLAGARSVTGQPLLCNDPHLVLSLPSIWYENHLVAAEFQATGVSVPGLPLITIGHNAHLAWGLTVAFVDCEDLFIEQFHPREPHRYAFRGAWLEAEIIPEAIRVKGRAEPYIERVLLTQHGPVVSDVIGATEQRLALHSMALRPGPIIMGWLRLNQARNWPEFVAAMRYIEAPALNVVYADVEGNIGYWVTGKVPIRARGDGRLPVPAWPGDAEWVGEVPFADMPHALNPQQGYIVTCNNRIVSDDYPYFLGQIWMNGYRACRITDVIASREKVSKVSPEECQALQLDVTCLPGLEFVHCLAGLSSPDPDVRLALDLLRAWDGQLTATSVGGALYEVARALVARNLLEPGLGKDLTRRLQGYAMPPLLPAHEFYGHDTVILLRLLNDPASWWVQQAGGREAVLTQSLKQAVAWLRQKLGPDVRGWQWGKLHRATFPHALGIQKPLDRVFNRGPWPIGGDTDTPCQTAFLPGASYDCNFSAPSYRQVIDLGDFSRSLAVLAPGQSGHLGSRHYDDGVEAWRTGDYHPMLWTRAQVEREAEGRLTLQS
jgi:penicillin amidase